MCVCVCVCAQVLELLVRAGKNRAVATTLCNERSSRSHSVFQLRLKGTNNKTSESCHGTTYAHFVCTRV